MKIFITGASGFVGGAATRQLVESGHDVYAMSRSVNSDAVISRLGGEPVRCDLQTVSAEHLHGCEVVIHAAAFVAVWGEVAAWENANVGGTKQMLKVARTAGVQRFIHIGTEAALVKGQDLHQVDESYPRPSTALIRTAGPKRVPNRRCARPMIRQQVLLRWYCALVLSGGRVMPLCYRPFSRWPEPGAGAGLPRVRR